MPILSKYLSVFLISCHEWKNFLFGMWTMNRFENMFFFQSQKIMSNSQEMALNNTIYTTTPKIVWSSENHYIFHFRLQQSGDKYKSYLDLSAADMYYNWKTLINIKGKHNIYNFLSKPTHRDNFTYYSLYKNR